MRRTDFGRRDHAKWQPVATAVYRFEPDIMINEEMMNTLSEEEKIAFVESCPAPVFRYNEQTRRGPVLFITSRGHSFAPT